MEMIVAPARPPMMTRPGERCWRHMLRRAQLASHGTGYADYASRRPEGVQKRPRARKVWDGARLRRSCETTPGPVKASRYLLGPSMPQGTDRNDLHMPNIIDTLATQRQFTTFSAALRRTPLYDALREAGPFTVFAPTDDAFDNQPQGVVNRLLEDPEKLTAILAYHIVPGRFTSADAARLSSSVTTLEGSDLRVATAPRITVNGAQVTQSDLLADNGVIHAIDQVLIPLDDLGNVRVEFTEYTDIIVVAPETELDDTPNEADEPKR